ncbi:type VI secretion system tube protein Hcp [Paucibacter sp. R3-3]|uniref:Type VI secretion system tube protein Hcp n=1 Tax=Roseateles agri TaxID=3098619 RepID=A0ABU5DJT0_9BURK|nr:type VI secretion system tube protein Hcp [Paucibacter sp. R3-3]MDY0745965.1 type VI secretion system tube protein Hcp [Paucibacter sp. R3-3]
MPGNSFINFGKDVDTGESPQEVRNGKNGWIEISDWSWDIEAEHNNLSGTGAAVGKPNPGTLNFSHDYDTSSAAILTKIVQGKSFDVVYIDMLKNTGGDKADQFFQIVMTNVFITKVSTKGGEDGKVTQEVDMVFKEVAVGYKAQGNDGKLVQAPTPFTWSITTMQSEVAGATAIKFT